MCFLQLFLHSFFFVLGMMLLLLERCFLEEHDVHEHMRLHVLSLTRRSLTCSKRSVKQGIIIMVICHQFLSIVVLGGMSEEYFDLVY